MMDDRCTNFTLEVRLPDGQLLHVIKFPADVFGEKFIDALVQLIEPFTGTERLISLRNFMALCTEMVNNHGDHHTLISQLLDIRATCPGGTVRVEGWIHSREGSFLVV